jgi:hypothetical protein
VISVTYALSAAMAATAVGCTPLGHEHVRPLPQEADHPGQRAAWFPSVAATSVTSQRYPGSADYWPEGRVCKYCYLQARLRTGACAGCGVLTSHHQALAEEDPVLVPPDRRLPGRHRPQARTLVTTCTMEFNLVSQAHLTSNRQPI